MTKKDYVKIARIFESLKHGDQMTWRPLVELMANMLKDDNPHFDRTRFYAACGMEDTNG